MTHYSAVFQTFISFINKQINALLKFSFILFILFSNNILAQDLTGYVDVIGSVKLDKMMLPGAEVTLYEAGRKVQTIVTPTSGRFKFKLDLQKSYTIEITAQDLITKKVEIKTNVPPEESVIWNYRFSTELFENFPGMDLSALQKPVSKVSYNEESDDFEYDVPYSNLMKTELDKILKQLDVVRKKLYDAAVAKADQFLSDKNYEAAISAYEDAYEIDPFQVYPDEMLYEISRLISNEKSDEISYNNAIAKADGYMALASYKTAKTYYEKASNHKPEETYPKTKIAEINNLIAKSEKEEAEIDKKEKEFTAAMAKAEAAVKQKNYEAAKTAYTQASNIRPDDNFSKSKIIEMNNMIANRAQMDADAKAKLAAEATAKLAAEKAKEEKYQTSIKTADGLLASKKYAEAKTAYNEALTIKPTETYPKSKITEIDATLASLAKADAAEKAKQEADAKAKATAEKALNDKYAASIKNGDAMFLAKKYAEAKTAFNEASNIKPTETYPKTKITEIDGILANLAKADAELKAKLEAEKALNDKYTTTIKNADALLLSKKYDEAKTNYADASKIKPTETYPKTKMTEIDGIISNLSKAEADAKAKAEAERVLNEKYQTAIKSGDDLLASKKYSEAKTSYNSASTLKPAETYPKTKVKEIDATLAAIAKADADAKAKLEADAKAKADAEKALNDKYAATVKKADDLLTATKYNEAKTAYNEALTIKPTETYPKTKISQIDATLATLAKADAEAKAKADAEKALNEKYASTIKNADALLASKKYDEAKTNYADASKLKPTETYPKTKIAEIDGLIAKLSKEEADAKAKAEAERVLNEKYQTAIKTGDDLMTAKKYSDAKTAYNSASTLKPSETYPKTKIKEIDATLAAIAKADADAKAKQEADAKAKADAEKALNDKYATTVKKADDLLTATKYNEAKTAYNEALAIKPAETYPKTKISQIDATLATLAKAEADAKSKAEAEKALNEKYASTIKNADALLASKNYNEAKTNYSDASKIKPTETYPKTKISEIDGILANLSKAEADAKAKAEAERVLNEKYQTSIKTADGLLSAKKYSEAKNAYNTALTLKPDESYPKGKIKEIDGILVDLAKADAEAKAKLEADAKAKAAAEKALNDKYAATIKDADALLASIKYSEAKNAYNEALKLKPTETYPKTKIAQIDATLANLAKADADTKAKLEAEAKAKADAEKSLNEKYANTIKNADALFASKKYSEAKTSYNSALLVKPDESYPKGKIKEIDGILEDLAKADADAKEKAEKDAKAKLEADAKAKAAAEKEKEEKYQAAIKIADDNFELKKYSEAKTAYNQASGFKPTETYPKAKIVEIDNILASIAKAEGDAKNKAAAEAKAKADAEAKAKELALAKQKNQQYDALIEKADNFMFSKNYIEAEKNYREASNLKPTEQYPKSKLAELSNLLAVNKMKQSENAEVQKKYDDAIAKADEFFKTNAYVSANASYNLAISIKPNEQYPRNQIEKIKQIQKKIEDANLAKIEAEKQQKIKEAQASVKKAELEEIDFNNAEVRTKYLSELAKKYKEGVTTENYEQTGKTVKRVIVNRNGIADEYREVKHSWGGVYWFKNGQSIASSVFYIDTKE